jgi:hypothetical protein
VEGRDSTSGYASIFYVGKEKDAKALAAEKKEKLKAATAAVKAAAKDVKAAEAALAKAKKAADKAEAALAKLQPVVVAPVVVAE